MPKRDLEPEKKEKLLAAARKEFAARGYEAASLNAILDEAGFSKGSFYWYFEDKTDLAATLLNDELAKSAELLKAMRMPQTADEFWLELRRNSFERLKVLDHDRVRYEAFIRLGNALLNDAALMERLRPAMLEARKFMGEFFERGVALGALRSDLPIGTFMAIAEAVKSSLYKSLYPGDQVPTEAQLEAFTDLFIDLLQRIARR